MVIADCCVSLQVAWRCGVPSGVAMGVAVGAVLHRSLWVWSRWGVPEQTGGRAVSECSFDTLFIYIPKS